MTDVLDHGYVNFVEKWGSDEQIIASARMSTDGAFRGWGTEDSPGDERLLRYLWTHRHATPFEMGGLSLEVQAPIFIAREWMRHRTFSYNELSARYVELPDLAYIPSIERLMKGRQAQDNKQGSGEGFTDVDAAALQDIIAYQTQGNRNTYEYLLSKGLSRELARLVVPVNQYTRFRASGNLRNWLGFLTLRTDTAAQWEMQEYARVVESLIGEHFPRTYELWHESAA